MAEQEEKMEKGYSLKNRKLRRWIYLHHRSLPYVARKMGLSKEELKRKLKEKECFHKDQICALIYLVGAKDAIEMIYFPTIIEKKEVKRKVFGERRKEGNGFERVDTKQ